MRLRSIRWDNSTQVAAAEPPPYLPLVLSRRLARKESSAEKPPQHTLTECVCVLLAALYGFISFPLPRCHPGRRLGVHLEPAR